MQGGGAAIHLSNRRPQRGPPKAAAASIEFMRSGRYVQAEGIIK
jgi:hypothetical protein